MFDELLDFFASLRSKGYKIGVEQCIAVHTLLSVLTTQDNFKGHSEELATWLAPIVCGTPQQQDEFYQEYRNWLRLRSKETVSDEQLHKDPAIDDPPPGRLKSRLRSKKVRLMIAASVLLTVAAIVTSIVLHYRSQTPVMPTLPKDDPALVQIAYDRVRVSLTPQAAPAITEQERLQKLKFWERFFYRYFTLVRAVVAGLPMLFLAGYWFWKFYRRLQLEKQCALKTPDLDRLPIEDVSGSLFRGAFFRRMWQGMRHQRETEIYELDIAATVESTARMAGLLDPIERPLKSTSEYLILIDRATFSDQQARFYDELVNRLSKNNIYIDRYYFKGDPRNCRKDETRKFVAGELRASYLGLHELRALHPGHDVLIFSDGSGLIDGKTGDPHQWVSLFSDWPSRIVLTPELESDWDYRESALFATGFVVLPTTKDGLDALVRVIQTGKAPKAAEAAMLPAFPELLREEEQDWIDEDEPPPADTIEELRIGLMQFLDIEDYYWLSACAVYPRLEWDLTVALGYRLTGKEDFEDRLIRLVRLPWFRHGLMPDWLRSSLISALPAEKEEEIRKALEQLLSGGVGKTLNASLSIARSPDDTEAKKLSTVWRNLLNKIKRLSNPPPPPPGDSALRDYVFLSFMSGHKPSRLAVALPAALRPLFFSGRGPWLRLSLGKLAVEAALAFALIFIFFPKRPELPPPPAPSAPDVEVIASPASGSPGSNYIIKVVSADPQKFALTDTALFVSPAPVTGITLETVANEDGVPAASELDTRISIDRNVESPEIPLEIRRNNTTLGRFSFTLRPGDDFIELAFGVNPRSERQGSDFNMQITSPNCASYSLKDAKLEPPNGSAIQVSVTATDDCTLTARVIIPASTAPGQTQFSLKRGDSTTSIPFTVTPANVAPADCPEVTINQTLEGDSYRFTAVIKGGKALSQPGFKWTAVARYQQGSAYTDTKVAVKGQGTSSILIKADSWDPSDFLMLSVKVTGYDPSCQASANGGGFRDELPPPTILASPPTPTPKEEDEPPPKPPPSQAKEASTSPEVECPKVSIAVSIRGGNYQFNAVVEGGKALRRPGFNWNPISRDQQGGSVFDTKVAYKPLQGDNSILIPAGDLKGVEVLIVNLKVTGYDPSCPASASRTEMIDSGGN